MPLVRAIRYVGTSPLYARKRWRAGTVAAVLSLSAIALTCVVPAPLTTLVEGVISVHDDAVVRATTDGFVDRIITGTNSRVRAGDPLFALSDPAALARMRVLEAEIAELEARRDAVWGESQVEVAILDEQIAERRGRLLEERETVEDLTIRSKVDGILVVPRAESLSGRFVRKGEAIAHVVSSKRLIARVVVEEKDVALVRHGTRAVNVRCIERIDREVPATIDREVPGASRVLPSVALGTRGGGSVVVDPLDERGDSSLENHFQFDLSLRPDDFSGDSRIGGRVYARFEHGWEPLVYRWYRGVKRHFLGRTHG